MVLQQQQETLPLTKRQIKNHLKISSSGPNFPISPSQTTFLSLTSDYVFQRFSGEIDDDFTTTCLIDGVTGHIFTYPNVQITLWMIAAGIHRRGIRHGDTVMLLLPNSPEFALSFLTVAHPGAISTTVNPFYTESEIAKQAKASGAEMIIMMPCYCWVWIENLGYCWALIN